MYEKGTTVLLWQMVYLFYFSLFFVFFLSVAIPKFVVQD